MEEKQFNQLFDLITRCVTGIRELQDGQKIIQADVAELKSDVAELKTDAAELKAGQARLEKEIQTTNRSFDPMAGEAVRVKARVDILEQELSN